MSLGPGSIALIVGAGLVLFGPKKLPEFGKSLGETLREFKKATKGLVDEETEEAIVSVKKTEQAADSVVSPEATIPEKTITIRSGKTVTKVGNSYKVVTKREHDAPSE